MSCSAVCAVAVSACRRPQHASYVRPLKQGHRVMALRLGLVVPVRYVPAGGLAEVGAARVGSGQWRGIVGHRVGRGLDVLDGDDAGFLLAGVLLDRLALAIVGYVRDLLGGRAE